MRILCFFILVLSLQNSLAQQTCFEAANKYRFEDLIKDSVKTKNYPFDSLTAYIRRALAMTINCKLPDDSFTDINGKRSSIGKLKGKALIIDFWSVYCIPCINSFPSFNALLKKYEGKLEVLAVTLDQKDAVLRILQKHGLSAMVVADAKLFFEKYSLGSGFPLTLLIDKDSRVVHFRQGVAVELEDPMEVYNEFSPLIEKVLKQK